MQPTNLIRSAPQVGIAAAGSREDQALIAAQPTSAGETVAGAAQKTDDSTTAFANELAQVADDQQPLLQPDAEASPERPVAEADTEQWLLHMLAQQSTQLQARTAEHGSTNETREGLNAATQALPRALAPQDLAEQAAEDQVLKASTETLKISLETLKASSGAPKASSGAPKALPAELPAGKLSAAVNGAVDTQPEKLGPAPMDSEFSNQSWIAQPERLAAGTIPPGSDVTTRIDPVLSNTPVTESAALERTLKLQGPETKWGEQLLLALRDSVELHMRQRVQNTTIRLDPPELGVMEIVLTHEQGRLNVQISAQHSDVVRLLQQTSDRLRHELVAQNFSQVDVEISGGQPNQQHSQRDQTRPFNEPSVLANQREVDQSDAHHLAPEQQTSAQHNDVLVTV